MSESNGSGKDNIGNRAAIIGIIVVVVFLGVTLMIRGSSLKAQNRQYQAIEESLDAEYASESLRSEELQEQKVHVKTKEYIIEKAREIFGLKMPDEVIVKPKN